MNILLRNSFQDSYGVITNPRAFAEECDRLSRKNAQAHKRKWGRWFLRHHALATYISRPGIANAPDERGSVYEVDLSRINKFGLVDKQKHYTWAQHLADKNWIGESGIADFRRALSDLLKTGQIV